jgi:hypothetical protein|tara:strand:- start:270 stop:1067 length:798 start_codon:yes stop_codon:yes gene_type:complete
MTQRTKTDVKKVSENDLSYLTPFIEEDTSTESLRGYRVLSRASIVQAMSDKALKEEHGESAVVLQPGSNVIANPGESFLFVPLFHFTEWIVWADRRDQNSPAIIERSFDPASEVARKSRNADSRMEIYSGGPQSDPFKKRHVENINFAGVLYNHPTLGMMPLSLTFSKGEFFQGQNFASACMNRRIGNGSAPLWSQVWSFSSSLRDKGERHWYGFNFKNPEEPYISKDDVENFRGLHEQLKTEFDSKKLSVNVEEVSSATETEEF